ncbi:MAG: hypothetical protein WBV82_22320 [Myxococcaceae bacterium]
MRTILFAASASLFMTLGVACSGGSQDLCAANKVTCESPLLCDPDDGQCKCGGRGGVVCAEGFACDDATSTCQSTVCAGVTCSQPGTTCDLFDGQCKCGGTGGVACSADQVCNPATKTCQPKVDCSQVACGINQTCDANTGLCTCGTSSCGEGQTCSVGSDGSRTCVDDLCAGVTCLGNTTCDPADGVCKCNGAACASGQVCGCPPGADAGTCADSARVCQSGSACANVTCGGGTTCDPTDGQCKCGGPGGPVCGTDQICSLTTLQCQGGNQCTLPDGSAKACPGGTSCDPEDGQCKCGGRGGDICSDGSDGSQEEICVTAAFSQVCRPKCNPLFQNCPNGTFCFFDTLSKTPAAYCAAPSDVKQEREGCASPTACFTTTPTSKGLFCNGLGSFDNPGGIGFCRSYCDLTTKFCSQSPVPQECVALPVSSPLVPSGVGFCQPI